LLVGRNMLHYADVRLPSPKLPLFDGRASLQAFVAQSAERSGACGLQPGGDSGGRAGFFTAFSAAELPALVPGVFHEKGLFDAFTPLNATLAVASAGTVALLNEVVQSGMLDFDHESGEPNPDARPADWGLAGSNAVLNFTRDVGGATTQRTVEKIAKPRVSSKLHEELVKHVGKHSRQEYLSAVALGDSRWTASCTAASAVLMSPVAYLARTLSFFAFDVLLDGLRTCFPSEYRAKISVQAFCSNLKLKTIKYSVTAVIGLCLGALVPFVWAHPYAYMFGSDLIAGLAGDALAGQFGTPE